VYSWMHVAYGKGYRFLGYAIMPNHVHFLIRVPEGGAINTLLGNGKRFMAYELVQGLMSAGRHDVLLQLQQGLQPSDVARGQKHRVFATDLYGPCRVLQWEDDRGEAAVHANPVSKRWMLAEDAVEYPHSSFAFYVRGEQRAAPLTAYHEFGFLDGTGAPW